MHYSQGELRASRLVCMPRVLFATCGFTLNGYAVFTSFLTRPLRYQERRMTLSPWIAVRGNIVVSTIEPNHVPIIIIPSPYSLMQRLSPDPATLFLAHERRATIKAGLSPLEVLWEVKRLLDLVCSSSYSHTTLLPYSTFAY